jgi:hypothetical protein
MKVEKLRTSQPLEFKEDRLSSILKEIDLYPFQRMFNVGFKVSSNTMSITYAKVNVHFILIRVAMIKKLKKKVVTDMENKNPCVLLVRLHNDGVTMENSMGGTSNNEK